MNRFRSGPAVVLLVAILFGCRQTPDTDPRMVSEWMRALYGSVRAERLSPPVVSRLMDSLIRARVALGIGQEVQTGSAELGRGIGLAIASQMVGRRNLSARDAARLFVVTAVAQSDAFIATWGYKFRFNLIRPRTYIRSFAEAADQAGRSVGRCVGETIVRRLETAPAQ